MDLFTVAFAILFVFGFQLITDFVEAVYAFGLLGVGIPVEIISVLFFFSPVLLLVRKRGLPGKAVWILYLLVAVTGTLEVWFGTRMRMLTAGLGTGTLLVLLPVLIWSSGQRGDRAAAQRMVKGLALAVLALILARAWNSGIDPAVSMPYRILLAGLALAGAWAAWRELWVNAGEETRPADRPVSDRPGGTTAPVLGFTACLILIYFVFTSPNVMARWTGANYPWLLGLTVFSAVGLIFALDRWPARMWSLRGALFWAWNLLFAVCLVGPIFLNQIYFPQNPQAYPIFEPLTKGVGWTADLVLYIACLLWPIVLLDFGGYARRLVEGGASFRKLSGSFALGSLLFVIFVFAQIFTTVYDYFPVIGPLFRNRFAEVITVLAGLVVVPLGSLRSGGSADRPRRGWLAWGSGALFGAAALAGALAVQARPAPVVASPAVLRVHTYNIQQGYSAAGIKNDSGQLDLMRTVGADIVGLQETDTNRIAGGNADIIRYFSERWNRYSYYGPKVPTGTFGVALLSRYPIENPRTFFLYSQGEQVGVIQAEIQVGSARYAVFVTHLGNDGPMIQQQQLLGEIQKTSLPVIAMADFNFSPETPQYRLTVQSLKDAWMLRWPTGVDDSGLNPTDRIDHIFVSPGIPVQDARILTGGQSDHWSEYIDIQLH